MVVHFLPTGIERDEVEEIGKPMDNCVCTDLERQLEVLLCPVTLCEAVLGCPPGFMVVEHE